jgi:hypothetical protein
MNDSKGRLAVERHLQKAFKSLKSSNASLETILTESAVEVSLLANFIEQLECVRSVEYSTVPFAAGFPDLRERLLEKIEREIQQKADTLTELM